MNWDNTFRCHRAPNSRRLSRCFDPSPPSIDLRIGWHPHDGAVYNLYRLQLELDPASIPQWSVLDHFNYEPLAKAYHMAGDLECASEYPLVKRVQRLVKVGQLTALRSSRRIVYNQLARTTTFVNIQPTVLFLAIGPAESNEHSLYRRSGHPGMALTSQRMTDG